MLRKILLLRSSDFIFFKNFPSITDMLNIQLLNFRPDDGRKLAALLEFSCGQHHVLFINLLCPFS